MERIASFCVDHTTLLPGMYLSRQDGPNGEILTWDIRMKRPNQGSYLSPAAAHTLEHLFATRARNSRTYFINTLVDSLNRFMSKQDAED